MQTGGRTLRVGAVQMISQNGKVAENLERALPFVEDAAKRGAKLIVLPEFMPVGYIFTKAIWDAGEPKVGQTVEWLCRHSKRLGVYLGTSYLEADGEDFFNTFVITTPEGTEAGRVRKQTPASFEAYFTKGYSSDHVIHTEFGEIGVGICYECMLAYTPKMMISQSVDIMLMPHCAPTPEANIFFPKQAVEFWDVIMKGLAKKYSTLLGVPAIFINRCGLWESPLPGLPMKQRSKFPGLTAIADSDGTVKAQLEDREGVIVEDVLLDPARKTNITPETFGHWSMKLPWHLNFFRFVEFCGKIWYSLSAERKRRALAISSLARK